MKYSQPVIVANMVEGFPQPFIKNQTEDLTIEVGVKPEEIICPYCHQKISTIINDKCSCSSCFFYSVMIIIFPIFIIYIMCINIEDCICEFGCSFSANGCCFPTCCRCISRDNLDGCLCCCDVDHYCPGCGNFIGKRDACLYICPSSCWCCREN